MFCFCCRFFTILHQFFLYAMLVYYRAEKTHLQLLFLLLLLHTTKNNCFGWVHLWVTIKIIFCAAMYQSTAMLPDYSWMCIKNSATVATVVAQQTAVIKVTIAKFQLFAAFYFHCTTELSTSPYSRPTERTKCLHWSSVKEPAFEKPHCKARKCLNCSEGDGTEYIPKKEKHLSIHERIHIHAIVIRRFFCCFYFTRVQSTYLQHMLCYHIMLIIHERNVTEKKPSGLHSNNFINRCTCLDRNWTYWLCVGV